MLPSFSRSVMLSGGRTVFVQPGTQIVRPIVACVTLGLTAPGVQCGSGSEYRPWPRAWHDPGRGWRWTTCALARDTGRPDGERRGGVRRIVWRRDAAPAGARITSRAVDDVGDDVEVKPFSAHPAREPSVARARIKTRKRMNVTVGRAADGLPIALRRGIGSNSQ